MTFHLLALRPEPGLAATLAKARALGLPITGHALSAIRPLAWDCPDPAGIDGLLIGSANAILHGGPHLPRLTAKPVYAVGEATAAAARAAGFTVALTGSGGLQGVLDAIAAPCHLLRIAGEEHVPLMPPPGVTFAEVIAYRSITLPLDPVAPLLASIGGSGSGSGGSDKILVLTGSQDTIMTKDIMQNLADTYRKAFTASVIHQKLDDEALQVEPIEGEGGEDTSGEGVRLAWVPGAGHHLQNDVSWKIGAEKLLRFHAQLG